MPECDKITPGYMRQAGAAHPQNHANGHISRAAYSCD